jgi:predicted N-formylglutamate amidohydrolase
MRKIILTCEHAGNKIPSAWQKKFLPPKEILESHRGIDIGAKKIAVHLEKALKCPFFIYENTRLLIELNRSLHHPKLFSEFSKHLREEEKQKLIETLYLPYRTAVEKEIRKRKPVIHLGIHSFTPIFEGVERDIDIGLLYDPKRKKEREFCLALKNKLPKEYRVKLNRPYLGKADGFTTHLRKLFKENEYLGIEIEVNQKIAAQIEVINALKSALYEI